MRNISPELAAELSSTHVSPVLLAELDFDSGPLRLWSGYGTFEWNGKVFTGSGDLIGISPIEETQEIEARGLVCTLNGISTTMISLGLNERIRGRKFRLYLGVVGSTSYVATEDEPGRIELEDGSGYVRLENELAGEPYRVYTGLMDTMEYTDNGDTADVRLSVENILLSAGRPKVLRYTMIDQQRRFPNDKGLEFINQLQDVEIVW